MRKREVLWVSLAGSVLLLIYKMIFGQYFPNIHGRIGHDYALFLPKLLDGYFWYHTNGLFAVPWFTPAFCGGIPLLPDPQSIYYSLPQFFSFVIDPLWSVYLTFLLFAGLGFAGFYVLLRRGFATTPWTALFGASLFLFNGFYAHRMIVGHLTYHPFMLIPFLAFLLLRPLPENRKARRWQCTFDVVMSGVLCAYLFQAGMVNAIVPALISVVVIGLMHGVMHGKQAKFWLSLSLAGLLAVALSFAKLVAAVAYLHHFARDIYKLPGAPNVFHAAFLLFQSLFVGPAHEVALEVLTNMQLKLGRHEFEFGVTFIPLLLILLGGVSALGRCMPRGSWRPSCSGQWCRLGAIAVLLFLPIILNVYTPAWNAFLKQVPIIQSSSSLIRWFSIYIPVVILLAALAVEKTPLMRTYQPYIVVVGIAVIVTMNAVADRDHRYYYHNQPYNPAPIVYAYYEPKPKHWTPVIAKVNAATIDDLATGRFWQRNDTLIIGSSQILCYEPLFGYHLEEFPLKTLRPGLALEAQGNLLNLKNPACYVYAAANDCEPGDHFTVDQYRAAEAFSTYRPFAFHMPIWQRAANVLNLIALAGGLAFLLVYACRQCSVWVVKLGFNK